MTSRLLRIPLLGIAFGILLSAQTPAPDAAGGAKPDKALAYYHYSLGHLYAELAGAYGNRGDYVTKAIESYRLALKADPSASFLGEELSDLYVQSGRLREAVTEAEEALKVNPDDLSARRILARIYMRMIGDPQQGKMDEGMVRKAIEQYEKIGALAPKDVETWITLGRLHKIAQNSSEAEKAYKQALSADPENEDALTGLALVYADLGDTKQATDLLRTVAAKSPSLRTLTALAGAYEQMREFSLAAETLRRTMELAPGNPEVKRAYAQNLLLANEVDEALKNFEELAAEDPKDSQSLLRISQIYRQKRDFAKAREASSKAKALDPSSLEVRYNEVNLLEAEDKVPEAIVALKELLSTTAKRTYSAGEKGNRVVFLERLAVLYRSQEQVEGATATFREIAALDSELAPRAAAQIVETYRAARDLPKAMQEADAAILKHPEDRTLRSVRASVLADTGETEQAVAEIKKLLDGKNDRETYLALAQVYDKSKNFGEMTKAIQAAENLSKTDDEKETIWFMRGAMYEKQKKYAEAEEEFRRVLKLDPRNASALNYLGYMLADRGLRLQEAEQMVQKALEVDPDNGAYLDSLGWVFFRLDRLSEAETYLLRAMEKFSRDPTVHDHLGDVYFKQGKIKEAITQWQASLQEWQKTPPSETDPVEIAKITKKLEGARVRLAKETSGSAPNRP